MNSALQTPFDDLETLPRMPRWISATGAEGLEDTPFLSGAAISHLDLVLRWSAVPQRLLQERLALRAAEACMAFSGRAERAGALRDAVQFLRPGDLPGPAGEGYLQWQRAVGRPLSMAILEHVVPGAAAERIADRANEARQGAPMARAAAVLEAVLTEAPRANGPALIGADAALALTLGWDHLVPLFAMGLKRSDLRHRGEDLRLACHRAILRAVPQAVHLARDLARRAAHLRAIAPKLRAKGAGDAVQMFLTRDAVAPGALPLPDRAARRLCDRLVKLGAVRELTGRDTFRLYGI